MGVNQRSENNRFGLDVRVDGRQTHPHPANLGWSHARVFARAGPSKGTGATHPLMRKSQVIWISHKSVFVHTDAGEWSYPSQHSGVEESACQKPSPPPTALMRTSASCARTSPPRDHVGADVIPRRARPGPAGLGPHTSPTRPCPQARSPTATPHCGF